MGSARYPVFVLMIYAAGVIETLFYGDSLTT